jgi:hypothetical protein
MKSVKSFSLAVLLALSTTISVVAYVQDATKKEPRNTDSCCAMACCKGGSCCKGDSCEMKAGKKNHSSGHACCCCNGDACEMGEMKNKEKQG